MARLDVGKCGVLSRTVCDLFTVFRLDGAFRVSQRTLTGVDTCRKWFSGDCRIALAGVICRLPGGDFHCGDGGCGDAGGRKPLC